MGRVPDAETTQAALDILVARLASRQYGVVSRAQVARLGGSKDVIRRRVASGRWEEIAPDVFALAGSPSSWHRSVMATCLTWGADATCSDGTAAALWDLAGSVRADVEITVPRERRRLARPGIVHRRRLDPFDRTTLRWIPVTTVQRTLLDLCRRGNRDLVEEALDDALRRKLVTVSRLRRRLQELSGGGRPGLRLMRELLDARDGGDIPRSVFETRFLRLLRRAGLPLPAIQYAIKTHDRVIAVVDFAYPAERIAIECDGYRWHSGRARWDHDRARRNELTLLGWRVLHVTWHELRRDPDAVMARMARALVAT